MAPDVGNADHFSVAGKVSRFVGGREMNLGDDSGEGHAEL
jgi:hypothetical protein